MRLSHKVYSKEEFSSPSINYQLYLVLFSHCLFTPLAFLVSLIVKYILNIIIIIKIIILLIILFEDFRRCLNKTSK